MTTNAGSNWQPRYIRQFIKHFDTGAGVILVETDQGAGYAKVLGNHTGPHALAREWVCTSLARWLGLPTFHFAMVDMLTENELPLARGGMAQPGPAFITRAERGTTWGGAEDELRKLGGNYDKGILLHHPILPGFVALGSGEYWDYSFLS